MGNVVLGNEASVLGEAPRVTGAWPNGCFGAPVTGRTSADLLVHELDDHLERAIGGR